jgi:hypothetical protein
VAAAAAIGIPDVVFPRIVLTDEGRVAGIKRPGDEGYDEVPIPEFVIGFPR